MVGNLWWGILERLELWWGIWEFPTILVWGFYAESSATIRTWWEGKGKEESKPVKPETMFFTGASASDGWPPGTRIKDKCIIVGTGGLGAPDGDVRLLHAIAAGRGRDSGSGTPRSLDSTS